MRKPHTCCMHMGPDVFKDDPVLRSLKRFRTWTGTALIELFYRNGKEGIVACEIKPKVTLMQFQIL